MKLLQDSNRDIRVNALKGLGNSWSKDLVPLVIGSLKDPVLEFQAAQMLEAHNVCEAIDELKLSHSSAAKQALSHMTHTWNMLPQSPVKRPSMSADTYQMWAQNARPKVDDAIQAVLDSKSDPIKRNLAWNTLAQAATPRAVETLIKIASDPQNVENTTAIMFLGSSVRPHDVLPDIAQLNEEKIIPFLRSVLNDPNSWNADSRQRQRYIAAASALKDAGDMQSVFEASKRIIATGDNNVFRDIEVTDSSLGFIVGVGKDKKYPEQIRFTAASMLARAGYKDQAVPLLSDLALNGANLGTRGNSLQILSQFGDDQSKEIVVKASSIPELKRTADGIFQNWPGGCSLKK
jgi:HEAT repeat protein